MLLETEHLESVSMLVFLMFDDEGLIKLLFWSGLDTMRGLMAWRWLKVKAESRM